MLSLWKLEDVMNISGVIDILNKKIAKCGNQVLLARQMGVSQAYLSAVLSGRCAPGAKILSALGMRSEIVYLPIDN